MRYTPLMLGDELARAQLGRSARQWVENRNWSSSIGEVRQIYKELIGQFQETAKKRKFTQKLARTTLSTLVTAFRSMDNLNRVRHGLPAPRLLMGKEERAIPFDA